MKDLVEYIVGQIVNKPDAVEVLEVKSNEGIELTLQVDPEDMGIVIGKGGQTIKAIRKILIIRAMADNSRVNLRLIEPEGQEFQPDTEASLDPNTAEDSEKPKPVQEKS